MASTGIQPQLEVSPPPPPPPISVSRAYRWVDLSLVMSVAFAGAVLGSVYIAFHPETPKYSNIRIVAAILAEATALFLFLVLFRRQGRSFRSIGLSFRWIDLPIALGLAVAAFVTMGLARAAFNRIWFLATQHIPQWPETRGMFAGTSMWLLVPFLLLNPFFEETLVRGYLTTEVIDLRQSVVLATFVSLALQTSYHLYYGVFGALVVGCGLAVLA